MVTASCGLTLDLQERDLVFVGRDGAVMDAGDLADAAVIDAAALDAVLADGARFDAGAPPTDGGGLGDGGPTPVDGGVGLEAGPDASTSPTWSRATIFITSALYDGNLGGLVGADSRCRGAAGAAGLGPGFVAVLSNSTTNAMDRAPVTGEIRDTTGALVAPSASDLWEGRLTNAVLNDESGSAVVRNSTAWTGSDLGMAEPYSGMFCGDWTRSDGGDSALQGNARARNYTWLYAWDVLCSEPAHLYCIGPAGP
jgi:hypothetical protein